MKQKRELSLYLLFKFGPIFTVQVWDNDFISADDFLGKSYVLIGQLKSYIFVLCENRIDC